MMYNMKNIVIHDDPIELPKCMYPSKRICDLDPLNTYDSNQVDINIKNQITKFVKAPEQMADLENRQDQLLKKLDALYERIKTISSLLNTKNKVRTISKLSIIPTPEEVVLVLSPDNLPWCLTYVLKGSNIQWHIHSSVTTEKLDNINLLTKSLHSCQFANKIDIRLIFKCVSTDSELKYSSLSPPILGNVNILRYLSFLFPSLIPYDQSDYLIDALLDECHIIEKSPARNKEALIKKLFSRCNPFIYGSEFSIVDLAAFNLIMQSQNCVKFVPQEWFRHCDFNLINVN